ncbi:hypothetical protein Tco_0099044 [Tanacetum coccineum]
MKLILKKKEDREDDEDTEAKFGYKPSIDGDGDDDEDVCEVEHTSGVICVSYRLHSGDQVYDVNDTEELRYEANVRNNEDIEDVEDNEAKFEYNPTLMVMTKKRKRMAVKVLEKHSEEIHVTWARFGKETKKKDKNQDRDHHPDAFSDRDHHPDAFSENEAVKINPKCRRRGDCVTSKA